jgi:ferredoxin
MGKYIGLNPFPPEFYDKYPPVAEVIKEKCIGCERCPKICFFDAIKMESEVAVINKDNCTGCGLCFESCPVDAIIWVPDTDPNQKPVTQKYRLNGIDLDS